MSDNTNRKNDAKCPDCGKTFYDKKMMVRHHRNIHQGIKWPCKYDCGKSFSTQQSRGTHHRNIHQGRKYDCLKCNKTFASRSGLEKHQQSIHQGIRYECKKCRGTFSRPEILKTHENSMHLGIRQLYPCDQCDRKFYSLGGLNRHIESIHQKIKHKCSLNCTSQTSVCYFFFTLSLFRQVKECKVTKDMSIYTHAVSCDLC